MHSPDSNILTTLKHTYNFTIKHTYVSSNKLNYILVCCYLEKVEKGCANYENKTNKCLQKHIYLLPIIIVNLLQISVTLCSHLPKDILQRQPSQPYSDGDTTHTQHMNTSYPYKFSTNNFICISYFNIYCESHI